MDSQEEQAPPSSAGLDQAALPAVPIPAQERQQLLSRLPPDVAPLLKAAADGLSNTADAQVCSAQTCDEMCRHGGCKVCYVCLCIHCIYATPFTYYSDHTDGDGGSRVVQTRESVSESSILLCA